MRGLVGWAALLLLAWALSENRPAIPWRIVTGSLALQWTLAVLLLNGTVDALQRATDDGTAFLFGYLGGGSLPFTETYPGSSLVLAFKVLPLVLVISVLGSLLFHWGVLQRITGAFAFLLRRTVGIDGPLALAAALHVLVGNVEAPLLIRPYLHAMQPGELFALMSCGMAGIAGTVMVIYATILGPVIPNALGTIIAASVIAMCSFANFGSVGIMVGSMGAMIPERTFEITQLGLRSLVSGRSATCLSGGLAGALT